MPPDLSPLLDVGPSAFDMQLFPFVRHLEAHVAEIQAELAQVPPRLFLPWPMKEANSGGWSVFCMHSEDPVGLMASEAAFNKTICPVTTEIVAAIPGLIRCAFSRLEPATHIYLHRDAMDEDCLRCSLPLQSNPGAVIEVNGKIESFIPGMCLVFHGGTLHQTANLGHKARILLLVDVFEEHLFDRI